MNIKHNNVKNTLVMALIAFSLFSCQKKDAEPVITEQEVVFSALEVAPGGGLKSTEEWECKDLSPDYAKILIGDDTYYSDVYRLGGKLYTNAIKLPVADGGGSKTYTVNGFFLMHDGGTKGNFEDDEQIVMATPTSTSLYKDYVSEPVALDFEVSNFQKAEIPIDVLCFQDNLYEGFGFDWFQVTEIVIREQCFFGDICVTDPELWESSIYNSQANGVQIDMPAIFYIDVTINGVTVPYSPFGNTSWFGEGAPLCVQYPDNLGIEGEEFEFKLYVLVRDDAGGFNYMLYNTWTFEDEEIIDHGGDGIVDFVIGDCNLIPPDVTIIELDDLNPPDDPVLTCETAFAYGGGSATCFLTIPELKNNRWGWTNGPLAAGVYTFPVYAAAGQCNLANGTLVGSLTVDYSNGTDAIITYNMDAGFILYGIHLYAGNDILPVKNGDYTVAPGQYPWKEDDLDGLSTYTHTFTGLSGNIHVVAHAVVCGMYQ